MADAIVIGIRAAARKHEVALSSVYRWVAEQRIEREQSEATETAPAAGDQQKATDDAEPRVPSQKSRRKAEGDQRKAANDAEPEAPSQKSRRKVAKSYTPSRKAEIIEYAAKHGPSAAAAHFRVSRFAIYAWSRKTKRAAAGEADAPTTGESAQTIEQLRDKEILGEWRKHPGLGPSQIRNQLRRAGIKVSVNTTRRVMEDAGYRPPKVQRQPHDQRYEAVRPNLIWHLDFLHRHINRASTFSLIVIDDCSRFVVGHGVSDAERADLVLQTFDEAVKRHGKPEMVLHDRGSAFWSWRGISRFTALLTELGIDQIPAEHKEWNGKLEVFNANLAKELFDVHRFYDLAEMRRRLAAHLDWYNQERTHHALGGLLVPADRYYGREQQVLARIEAGAGRDVPLDLRTRALELFKIISANGAPEVWLMGKKILDLGV